MTTELTLSDILGTCTIAFKQRVANLIKVGNKGRFLMIKKNAELESEFRVTNYSSAIFDLDDADLKTKIQQALNRKPTKVIVLEYKTTIASVIEEVKKLNFDWLCSLDADNQTEIASYAKENEVFAVVYKLKSDSEWVISVNNPSAVLANDVKIGSSSKITGLDLLPIIGGLCAGCSYDQAITGFVLSELKSIDMPAEIEEGQLTLYNEEEGVRVASPVNTLLTLGAKKTSDMKKITIMEGIKRYKTDMQSAFRTGYKGKYKNKYDNQQLFISAGKGYQKELTKLDILDDEYSNSIDINAERVRGLWIATGKSEDEINAMSDLEIRKLTFKDKMCIKADVKFLDAIESCEIEVEMY